ncbi:MAG: sulfatase [Acidobacteriota bacterium]
MQLVTPQTPRNAPSLAGRLGVAAAGLALTAALAGCGTGQGTDDAPPAAAGEDSLNVVLVLVDAMRADRLGPYGYDARPVTPNLDAMAAEAVVFERAVSQAGWTVPSVASLFSGVDPQAHKVLKFIDSKAEAGQDGHADKLTVMMESLSDGHTTVAEKFAEAGYQTQAIVKSDVVSAGRGFDQGFADFEFVSEWPKAHLQTGEQLTDRALEWLETGRDGNPFYLYLHYMDVHSSYMAPAPWYGKYAEGIDSDWDGSHMQVVPFHDGDEIPTEADIEKLWAHYDEEIEYWDDQFGRLLDALEAKGMMENTIVVLVADHGEAFYEHGEFFHSDLYQQNIHVPLILRMPEVEPRRFDHWVELTDVGPTLAELTGVGVAEEWTGKSHAAAIRGGEPVVRPVYSEFAGSRMLIEPETGLKLLTGKERGDELYDLVADPGEKTNLAEERPEDLDRLKRMAHRRYVEAKQLSERFPKADPSELTAEQIEALKSLGYLGN